MYRRITVEVGLQIVAEFELYGVWFEDWWVGLDSVISGGEESVIV